MKPETYKVMIPINLRFFDGEEKSEKPTARKKDKARKEGQVAKSQEIGTAFLFIFSFLGLRMFAGGMLETMLGLFSFEIVMTPTLNENFETVYIANLIAYLFGQILLLIAPLFAVVMVVGLISNIIQVGWHPTAKPLKPKISALNPLKGIKRLFSMQALVTLLKSLLKFAVIGFSIYTLIQDEINIIPAMLDMELGQAVAYIGDLIVNMGLNVGMVYVVIAAADYAYTRYKHTKSLKMTKQEVKEEWKQTEGNPQIKGKIRQKMREVSMRRMMQSVPQADVIITNPTHYAVALKYDHLKSGAPVLLAKGVDFLAKRIKEAAKEYDIMIVENPPLARTIYADVEINQEIPPELYEAVAEIMAFVFRLKNKV